MLEQLPYCGSVPHPGELLTRFNLDPLLLAALAAAACWHLSSVGSVAAKARAATGWVVATAAFVSPLCALSVALFSARVAQHMTLILLAAPLIASAVPTPLRPSKSASLWLSAAFFFVSLWFWHMPVPYDATFASTPVYWTMHLTLFGSAILLWRELLNHQYDRLGEVARRRCPHIHADGPAGRDPDLRCASFVSLASDHDMGVGTHSLARPTVGWSIHVGARHPPVPLVSSAFARTRLDKPRES